MKRLRIALDAEIRSKYGPEVCWTWRLLLSGIGLSWEEVPLDGGQCDIAYVSKLGRNNHSRVCVLANGEGWDQASRRRLAAVGRSDGWAYPIYTDEQPSPQLCTVVDGCLVYLRDIVFDVYWLVTGQEERSWPKNQHGHMDLSGSAYQREQALRLAMASSIGAHLERTLAEGGIGVPIPRWPNGKRAAACVGHDVDYPEVIRWLEPFRVLLRRGIKALPAATCIVSGKRNHWHFDSWIQMEKELGVRSAFYFVPRKGSLRKYAAGTPDPFYDVRSERFRALFKRLASEGFEIGMHASYRAWEAPERFANEKQQLEKASGQRISGNRHHYWHLNPDDPESTLRVHEDIGLTYDTSLSHERYVGWRRGMCWPFFPFDQKEKREIKTLQISTAWMDDHLFGHRKDNPGDRTEVLQDLTDTVADQGGCLLIDIHDYVFDDVLFPGWASTYHWLLEHLGTRSDFWIATPVQIADHWITRYASVVQASVGLVGMTEPNIRQSWRLT